MSTKTTTENFYRKIIEKVIDKMKEEFNNEGISEDILGQLKKIWEEKLIQNGIFTPKQHTQNMLKNCYPKVNLYMKNDLNPIQPNAFKSTSAYTTNDNIKKFNTMKEIQSREMPYRFITSTITDTYNSESRQINSVEVKNQTKENNEEIEIQLESKDEGEKEDKSDVDSDVDVFVKKEEEENNKKNNKENPDEEEDELLSSMSSESNDVEVEAKDFLLAQYEKIHRVRNKWKLNLKDAILHYNGKEYVFDRVNGELERDW